MQESFREEATPSERDAQRGVRLELLSRLQQHGVRSLREDARDDELADLLTAVENFERAVEQAGGDLFVDDPDSSEPEKSSFVLPRVHEGERVKSYIRRVDEAARRVSRRPEV